MCVNRPDFVIGIPIATKSPKKRAAKYTWHCPEIRRKLKVGLKNQAVITFDIEPFSRPKAEELPAEQRDLARDLPGDGLAGK